MRTKKPTAHPKGFQVFVGIDMSITSPGVCWSYARGTGKEYCGSWNTPVSYKRFHRIERFNHIADDVKKMFYFPNSDPRKLLAVIEDYAFAAGGRTFEIAECCGILKWKMIYEMNIPPQNIILCSTTHLKMFACQKGNAPKDAVLKEVFKRWGFDTNDNNKADAYVLWRIARALAGEDRLTEYQKDIVGRIRKYNK